MKEYIDFNTRLRTAAKNDFEKKFLQINEQQCIWKDDGKH